MVVKVMQSITNTKDVQPKQHFFFFFFDIEHIEYVQNFSNTNPIVSAEYNVSNPII